MFRVIKAIWNIKSILKRLDNIKEVSEKAYNDEVLMECALLFISIESDLSYPKKKGKKNSNA